MTQKMLPPMLIAVLPLLVGVGAIAPQEATDATTATPDALVIQGDKLTLGELMSLAREQLGIDCFLGPQEQDKGMPMTFDGSITLPPEDFLPFFEQLLRTHNYLHFETQAGSSKVHHILPTHGGRGSALFKSRAAVISPDEVKSMVNRTTLITTTYTCKHLPARDAVNTLQPYFADNFTQNVRNIEGTPYILMTGYASSVAGLLDLLGEIDVEMAEDAPVPFHPGRVQKLEGEVQRLSARVQQLENSR